MFKQVIGLWSFSLGSLHFRIITVLAPGNQWGKGDLLCIKVLTAKEKAVDRDLHTFIQKFVALSSPVELQFLFFLRLFQNVDSSIFRYIWLSCLSSDCMAWKHIFIQLVFPFVSVGSSLNGLQNLSNSS